MNKYYELLFLKQLKGFGPVKINELGVSLINRAETIDELQDLLVKAGYSSMEEVCSARKIAEQISATVMDDESIRVITTFDADYPKRFNQLGAQRPNIVYVKGSLDALNMKSVGVIGTRKPSNEGASNGISLAQSICEKNKDLVVVSGLALGCDTIGHMAAVESGSGTIAVLPGGINKISPATNKSLANKIVETGGCLVSEYEPNVKATPYSFVRRDSLIAALSDGLLVIQCGKKSGTMHTVEFAEKFNKRIAVYKGMFADGDFSGNMELLKDKDTRVVKNIDDVSVYIDEIKGEELSVNEQMSIFEI